MPRKRAKPSPPAPVDPPIVPRRRSLRTFLAAVLALGTIIGIVLLGLAASAEIRSRQRYQLPLQAIDFHTPPWVNRDIFLSEVRYLGELPEQFNPYDSESLTRVRRAFELHPLVAGVNDDGYVTVAKTYPWTILFRQPVLDVQVENGTPTRRIVDSKGILLPTIASVDHLTRLVNRVPPPQVPAGQMWDDPIVQRAAELAQQFDAKTIEKTDQAWRVVERSGRTLTVGW